MAVEKAMCHVVRKRAIVISIGFRGVLRRIEDGRRKTHGSLRIFQLAIKSTATGGEELQSGQYSLKLAAERTHLLNRMTLPLNVIHRLDVVSFLSHPGGYEGSAPNVDRGMNIEVLRLGVGGISAF